MQMIRRAKAEQMAQATEAQAGIRKATVEPEPEPEGRRDEAKPEEYSLKARAG